MGPLIITEVRHAVPKCCKGNATGLERLSCDNAWLIGGVGLSSEYQSCEECDLCPIQDIEVVIDWFRTAISGAIKMTDSPISAASEFSCPAESVDQEECHANIFFL